MSDKGDNKTIGDLWRILCASALSVIVLFGIMVFSPLASQIDDEELSRGGAGDQDLDSLMRSGKYPIALCVVDSMIAEKGHGLPRFAYFDRFLPEEERYDAGVLRAEIYDLQWKRIEILQAANDIEALKVALEGYSELIGYNRQRAKALLSQIKDKLHEDD